MPAEPTPSAPVDDRRSFLKTCGRFAATVPPAITIMLSTSLSSEAIAASSGGGGGGLKDTGGSGGGDGSQLSTGIKDVPGPVRDVPGPYLDRPGGGDGH